jgi:hypothetical protein
MGSVISSLEAGGRLLEDLLGLDAGHRGPRTGCGNGHDREFISYLAKTIDTVVGPVRRCMDASHCWDQIWQRPHSQDAVS